MKWLLLQWKQNVSDLLINPCLSCQTTLQNNGEQNFLLYILLPISLWQQKKDFRPENRKRFCARIATGDYDAIIIGHSQFEKIPLSAERQRAVLESQIDEIEIAITLAKKEQGENYTIKQMVKSRKSLEVRLEKLNKRKKMMLLLLKN